MFDGPVWVSQVSQAERRLLDSLAWERFLPGKPFGRCRPSQPYWLPWKKDKSASSIKQTSIHVGCGKSRNFNSGLVGQVAIVPKTL